MVNDQYTVETVVETLCEEFNPPRSIRRLERWRQITDAATTYVDENPDPFVDVADQIVAAAYREATQDYARVEETTGKRNLSNEIQDNLSNILLLIAQEDPASIADHQRRLVSMSLETENQNQTWNFFHLFSALADYDRNIGVDIFDRLTTVLDDPDAGDQRSVAGYYVRCFATDHEAIAERGISEIQSALQSEDTAVRVEAAKFLENMATTGFLDDEDPPEAVFELTDDLRALFDDESEAVQAAALGAARKVSEYVPARFSGDVDWLTSFIGHEEASFSASHTLEQVIEADPSVIDNLPSRFTATLEEDDPKAKEHTLRVLSTVAEVEGERSELPPVLAESRSNIIAALEDDVGDVRDEASSVLSKTADSHPEALVNEADQIVVGLTADQSRLYTQRTLQLLLEYESSVFNRVLPACQELLQEDTTTRSTQEAVVEVIEDAAEHNPRRVRDLVPDLGELLERDDDDIAFYACSALLDISREYPEDVVDYAPALLDIVGDQNSRARSTAAMTLEKVAEVEPDVVAGGVDTLIDMYFEISRGKEATQAKDVCTTILEQRPGVAEELVPEIRTALKSDDTQKRRRALFFTSSVALYQPEPFFELQSLVADSLTAEEDKVSEIAADCLGTFADQDADRVVDVVPDLGEALQHDNSDVRSEAADALWHVSSTNSDKVAPIIDDITRAFRTSTDHTKDSMCRVLSQLTEDLDDVSEDLLAELVEFGLSYTSSIGTSNAMDAIGGISKSVAELNEETQVELRHALQAESSDRRENATAVLRVLSGQSSGSSILGDDVTHTSPPAGTDELLDPLTEVFDDPNEDVRKHAAYAVCGLARATPDAVGPILDDVESLVEYEMESNGQAMFGAAEALYYLADEFPDRFVAEESDLLDYLVPLAVNLDKQVYADSPAADKSDMSHLSLYTTHGAKALGRVADVHPEAVHEAVVDDDDNERLIEIYNELSETQENFLGLLKELSFALPELFGEENEELQELFEGVDSTDRGDVAEIYSILAASNVDAVVDNVPELMDALNEELTPLTMKKLLRSVATIVDKQQVDLTSYREMMRDLFNEDSLDMVGEVILIDLLARTRSTVDLDLSVS